jgi:endonuclease-8
VRVPEGDSLHRAARRLQVLVGERVEVETPNPRARAAIDAGRLDGRRLISVEAVGKNLLLRFEGGFVLRNHLRMSGRWRVGPRGTTTRGRPWLVLRGMEHEAVLYGGRVLELHGRALRRLGPDILAEPPDFDRMVASLRREHGGREIGDALVDQRLVAGIGNVWRTEALWRARLSPWRPLASLEDAELRAALEEAARLMRRSVETGREEAAPKPPVREADRWKGSGESGRFPQLRGDRGGTGRFPQLPQIYRRAGRPCPRCRTPIRSRGQGDDNRTAYWCPTCQPLQPSRAGPASGRSYSRGRRR